MLRILRAFAWLRWRMLLNSLERTGARDTLERFSLAIEKLGPILLGVLMIPSALVLAVGAVTTGYALARGDERPFLLDAARLLLAAVPIFSVVGTLFMPAGDRTNPVRLLLLPISRRTLYVAQASSALGDVWIVLTLPMVLFLPVGLLAGGAFSAALLSFAGGALLVLVLVGISSLTTSLLHLAVRDRRRGELLALLFIVILPAMSMVPGLMHGMGQRDRAQGRSESREEMRVPGWVAAAGSWAKTLYPTELYVTSTRDAARHEVPSAGARLAALAGTGAALHAVGLFVFGRVLASPGSSGARRQAGPMRTAWGRTLPGLSSGASAVALAQLRLALRTPRGRAILLSPVVAIGIFGVLMRRSTGGTMDLGSISLNGGLSLATFGSFVSLISILPIAMNQFAVDRAGLTLALLSPLTDGEYLAGKAIGNGLVAAAPTALCLMVSIALFPTGSPALWAAIPLGLLAIYFLVAPAAAVFSAVLPRVVDLNSVGRGSNAHGLAGLLGLLAFLAAAVPCVLLALIAIKWLDRPALVPVFLLAWCAVAYGLGRLLFVPARRVFSRRRENLAMLV
jgi:hypothetical protein